MACKPNTFETAETSMDIVINVANTAMPNLPSNTEINEHPILDDEQRTIVRQLRRLAEGRREDFPMLQFAEVALRAAGREYAIAGDDDIHALSVADIQLRKNAVLYVYEALRATDNDLIRQWPEFDEMLRSLAMLAGDLP